MTAHAAPAGNLTGKLIRNGETFVVDPELGWPPKAREVQPLRLGRLAAQALPRRGLPVEVNEYRLRNLRNVQRGLRQVAKVRAVRLGVPVMLGTLHGRLIRGNGQELDLGLISAQLVTDTGVGYIVDAFQNLVELENMRYHGYGTGGAAEAAGNTGLTTELTTQYNPDSTRPTGTQTEAAANIFQTVATLTPDSGGTIAVTEHGIFSASSAGVLLDRSLFAAVNVVAGSDSFQTTYNFTIASGG